MQPSIQPYNPASSRGRGGYNQTQRGGFTRPGLMTSPFSQIRQPIRKQQPRPLMGPYNSTSPGPSVPAFGPDAVYTRKSGFIQTQQQPPGYPPQNNSHYPRERENYSTRGYSSGPRYHQDYYRRDQGYQQRDIRDDRDSRDGRDYQISHQIREQPGAGRGEQLRDLGMQREGSYERDILNERDSRIRDYPQREPIGYSQGMRREQYNYGGRGGYHNGASYSGRGGYTGPKTSHYARPLGASSPPSLMSQGDKNREREAAVQEQPEEEVEYQSDSDASSYDQDKVEIQIEKVDAELAKQERILATARAKIAAQRERLLEKDSGDIKNVGKGLSDSILGAYRVRQLESCEEPITSMSALIGEVYAANRKLSRYFLEKSHERDEMIYNFGSLDLENNPILPLEPIPSPKPQRKYFSAPNLNPMLRHVLVRRMKRNYRLLKNEEDTLVDVFLQYREIWDYKIESLEKGRKIDDVQKVHKEETIIVALPDPVPPPVQIPPGARTSRNSGFRSDTVRSEAEWVKALSFLGIEESGTGQPAHNPFLNLSREKIAKDVPMLSRFDLLRQQTFFDQNFLVKDPEKELAEYNSALDVKWSDHDCAVFKTRLVQEGKDFVKISEYLPQKNTQDCVLYYYREKVNLRFKNLIRRNLTGRGRRKKDKGYIFNLIISDDELALPLFATYILSEDEEFVHAYEGDVEDFVQAGIKRKAMAIESDAKKKAKKTLAAPVVEDLPVVLPLNTSADQVARKTVSYWSVNERLEFLKVLATHGKNFEAIAQTLGSKSAIQVRNYFHNSRRKLDLDTVLRLAGHLTGGQIHDTQAQAGAPMDTDQSTFVVVRRPSIPSIQSLGPFSYPSENPPQFSYNSHPNGPHIVGPDDFIPFVPSAHYISPTRNFPVAHDMSAHGSVAPLHYPLDMDGRESFGTVEEMVEESVHLAPFLSRNVSQYVPHQADDEHNK